MTCVGCCVGDNLHMKEINEIMKRTAKQACKFGLFLVVVLCVLHTFPNYKLPYIILLFYMVLQSSFLNNTYDAVREIDCITASELSLSTSFSP
jgi:hypothetical protein